MRFFEQQLSGLFVIENDKFLDERGYFMESYNKNLFNSQIGKDIDFIQDNHSVSSYGVLRGMHYQINKPQAKLVRVIKGSIFDVAVDIRSNSETFGMWFGLILSEENKKQLWIPEGFAHGFLSLEDDTHVFYKVNNNYVPDAERSLIWSDPDIGIKWPRLNCEFLISKKDKNARSLKEADLF